MNAECEKQNQIRCYLEKRKLHNITWGKIMQNICQQKGREHIQKYSCWKRPRGDKWEQNRFCVLVPVGNTAEGWEKKKKYTNKNNKDIKNHLRDISGEWIGKHIVSGMPVNSFSVYFELVSFSFFFFSYRALPVMKVIQKYSFSTVAHSDIVVHIKLSKSNMKLHELNARQNTQSS